MHKHRNIPLVERNSTETKPGETKLDKHEHIRRNARMATVFGHMWTKGSKTATRGRSTIAVARSNHLHRAKTQLLLLELVLSSVRHHHAMLVQLLDPMRSNKLPAVDRHDRSLEFSHFQMDRYQITSFRLLFDMSRSIRAHEYPLWLRRLRVLCDFRRPCSTSLCDTFQRDRFLRFRGRYFVLLSHQ
jgi:hypothetical protein